MPIVSDFLKKKENGRYYTERNPFAHPAFLAWAQKADLRRKTLLEPFAGRKRYSYAPFWAGALQLVSFLRPRPC